MQWMGRVQNLFAVFLLSACAETWGCPTECQCIGRVRVTVYCDFKDLEKVPENIPLETTHLFFMGNKFRQVVPAMFMGNVKKQDGTFLPEKGSLDQLQVIRLDLNPITIVNEHAFDRAPSLKLIYLPFDVKIQRQAFAEMKNDKQTFDGFTRVPIHPLEDPQFAAFSKF
ncbi:hypothetical protein Poli38472_005390 [Pythium oligandrum]|uniref:LRRNT domain-containing protein n=1 Tax=Pythium oligandrum TaxID=41045 RepID=A0A8K1CII1_PYTOL|nr:hypothetical protein Poli38472_005390 [Pythium oligandrum]|eukprot:TMW62772.1 hypothetical protein Poli38472_005390 [Pythium oligandrum]